MKKIMKLMTVLLALCLLLSACSLGGFDIFNKQSSIFPTKPLSDEERIVGKWRGSFECGEYFNSVMAIAMGEDASDAFDFSGLSLDVVLEFTADGKYAMDVDKDSVEAFADEVIEELLNGLSNYLQTLLGGQLGGKTLDEYLSENNMDLEFLLEQSGLDTKEMADDMISSFDDVAEEGAYSVADGVLTMGTEEHAYKFVNDTLILEAPEGATDEVMEYMFPMELKRVP